LLLEKSHRRCETTAKGVNATLTVEEIRINTTSVQENRTVTLPIEDRIALGELVSRYNQAVDHHEAEAWAATFTPDGALIANGIVRATGTGELTEYIAVRRRTGKPKLRHWVNNLLVEGDGDRARLRLYIMAFNIGPGLGAPYVMGEYDDVAVKIDGTWLFESRHMTVVAGGSLTGK
jgi:hypothetical protein